VKAVLLDQGVTAGVGNIYADESLFRAGIRPTRRGRRVKGEECERLAAAVRGVLAEAIEAGGSTLRDYADADGRRGRAQEGHAVYGRGGEACVRCGGTLRQGVVGQRTTVWCASCQK
jgi:formamidopyrimidine-DNA glycosylase